VSWGFADCSVRVCHVETERPLFVWEQQQQQLAIGNVGEIICCSAASDKILVTGSTNTVVSVWDVCERELRLKSHMFGHSEPITCIAASPSYNIIVSGSKDASCIVWDLARLSFVRQLVPHTSSVDAVAVNELTGDIATCSSSWLHLWSINGDLIASMDTAGVGGGAGGGVNHGILCVTFSILNDWDSDNVVMTGSMDGVVRLWSVRYFQVPEESTRNKEKSEKGGPMAKKKSSEEDDSSILTAESPSEQDAIPLDAAEKQGDSEHLAAEVFDPDKDRDSMEDVHKAAKEPTDSEGQGRIIEEVCRKSESPHPPPVIRRHRNRAHSSGTDKDSSPGRNERDYEAKKAKRRSDIPISAIQSERDSEDGSPIGRSKHPLSSHSKPAMRIRASKSEASLSFEGDENDSFEVVSDAEVARMRFEERKLSHGAAVMEAHKLRDGHVWERKLLFRGKLTSHTAYDRKDNAEPASITCITTSKDHKYVYIGDARGRIFSWSV